MQSSCEGERGFELIRSLEPMSSTIILWISSGAGVLRPGSLSSALSASMSIFPGGVSTDSDPGWDGHRMTVRLASTVTVKGSQNEGRAYSQTGRGQGEVSEPSTRDSRTLSPFSSRIGPDPQATAWTSKQSGKSWKLYAFPKGPSATQSHYAREPETARTFTHHSHCGRGRPPQITPPNSDTSKELFSKARPRLLPL